MNSSLTWILVINISHYLTNAIIPSAGGSTIKTIPNSCPVALAEFSFWYKSIAFSSNCTVFVQAVLSPHNFSFAVASTNIFAISDWSGTLAYTVWVIRITRMPEIIDEHPTPMRAKLTISVWIIVSYKEQGIAQLPVFVFSE